MEIIKEIRVRAEDLVSIIGNESSFSVKAPGLINEFKSKKNIYVSVRDVDMPSVIKPVSLYFNYVEMHKVVGVGAQSVEVAVSASDIELLEVNTSYLSMDDLCIQLTHMANRLIKSDCKYHGSDHSKHICENIPLAKMIKINFVKNRFVLKNGQGQVTFMSKDTAILCGLDNAGIVEQKDNKDVIRLEGQVVIGKAVSFFGKYEKMCHMLLDVVVPRMSCDEKNFGLLFSFNNEKQSVEKDNRELRKVACYSDVLRFHIVDDSMKPINFEKDLNSSGLRFTLIFMSN